MDGVQLKCAHCGSVFTLCRHCWRGNRYCGKVCASEAKVRSHRVSQRRYTKTVRGRESHRRRQRTYRKRRLRKTETDPSPEEIVLPIKPAASSDCCRCCGHRLETFIVFKADTPRFYSFRRRRPLDAAR